MSVKTVAQSHGCKIKYNKKIMVVTHAGGSPYHGPNMRWYYLGRALKPLGVNVEIVSSTNFHKYLVPPKVDRLLHFQEIDEIAYHWLRTSPYSTRGVRQVINQIEFILGCYRAGRQLCARKPDVVIASSPHPLVNFPAVSIARNVGADFIFEVRDLWPEILLELGSFSNWHPYILALSAAERYGVKHAKKIVSVKPGDIEYFEHKYRLSLDKFCYIPNGFLPEDITQIPPRIVQQLRRRYHFIVGYVGALSSYYALEHMIQLARFFKANKNVGFVIVGKGDKEHQLIEMIAAFGLSNCHLVGPIEKSRVLSCLDLFDACYVGLEDLAIHRYGISCNKIYEYMYAGKPIIGSYVTKYDPVSEAGCGITARPGNYGPLVENLEKLIRDKELRKMYGLRARTYFDTHHDFRVIAKTLVTRLFSDDMRV